MATSNDIESLEARLAARCEAATADGRDRDDSLRELKELLLEDHLPPCSRLTVNYILAWRMDRLNWFEREEHRLAAEQIYDAMSAAVSNVEGYDIAKRNCRIFRMGLDVLAYCQRSRDLRLRAAAEPSAGSQAGATQEQTSLDDVTEF